MYASKPKQMKTPWTLPASATVPCHKTQNNHQKTPETKLDIME